MLPFVVLLIAAAIIASGGLAGKLLKFSRRPAPAQGAGLLALWLLFFALLWVFWYGCVHPVTPVGNWLWVSNGFLWFILAAVVLLPMLGIWSYRYLTIRWRS